MIIKEHYWLGSQMAILSRSFCNVDRYDDMDAVEEIFFRGVREIRTLEEECARHARYFTENRKQLEAAVRNAVEELEAKQNR